MTSLGYQGVWGSIQYKFSIYYQGGLYIVMDDMVKLYEIEKGFKSGKNFYKLKNGTIEIPLWEWVTQSRHVFFLSQRKYTLDLLGETWILGCKLIDILVNQI